jgi:sulfur carrier protein
MTFGVTVNGREVTFARTSDEPGISILELLAQAKYPPNAVAVAVNGEFVPRSQHAETKIGEGDSVEILSPQQGG